MSTKNRDYFFDNYKALLIVLVVVGHFIEPCYDNNVFLSGLKWIIFPSTCRPLFLYPATFPKRGQLWKAGAEAGHTLFCL